MVGIKMMALSDELLNEHYSHLVGRDFFGEINTFMRSTPIIACCWEGVDAVDTVRLICGITKAREAEPGTILRMYAMSVQANLVHASDRWKQLKSKLSVFSNRMNCLTTKDVLQPFIYSVTGTIIQTSMVHLISRSRWCLDRCLSGRREGILDAVLTGSPAQVNHPSRRSSFQESHATNARCAAPGT